jgi:replicative DNA helicase
MADSKLLRRSDRPQEPEKKRRAGFIEKMGPAPVSQVMQEVEHLAQHGGMTQFHPMATGFVPLDDVLNGGMRPGELMVLGGPYGVGKTILGLQLARNIVHRSADNRALYVCYEHDRAHLMSRLICLESAEHHGSDDALTLRKLAKLSFSPYETSGLISNLRRDGRYRRLMDAIDDYADRLVLAKASSTYTTLGVIESWIDDVQTEDVDQVLLVVDYLQKVAVNHDQWRTEDEVTTMLTHGLKDLALSKGIHVVAIAAADRFSLQGKRMRLADLRGSSALQYETDIGLVLNNKYDIVSREHLIYNLTESEAMRNWVVLSVEKNRAGRHAVDMEYALDAAHFRIIPEGDFVRERLIDGKSVLE